MKRIYFAALSLVAFGCYNEEDYIPDNQKISEIVKVEILDKAIRADGKSFVPIKVTLPSISIDDRSKIDLSTTVGSFDQGKSELVAISVPLTIRDGKAFREKIISLLAPVAPSSGEIQVKCGALAQITKISFDTAFPTAISVQTDSLVIGTGFAKLLKVTVSLASGSGFPSKGTRISLDLKDRDGNPLNFYYLDQKNKSNAAGQVVNKISLGDNAYTGKIILTATTIDQQKHLLSAVTSFYKIQ